MSIIFPHIVYGAMKSGRFVAYYFKNVHETNLRAPITAKLATHSKAFFVKRAQSLQRETANEDINVKVVVP